MPPAAPRRAPRQQLGAALALLQRGDIARGAAALDQLLKLYPDDPTALGLAGAVALQRGDRPRAIRLLSAALRHQPGDAGAHSNLGLALMGENRPEEAETHFAKALELKPNAPEAMVNLGNLKRERGDIAGAEPLYRRALELRPDLAEAQNSLALVLESTGRVTEARRAAEAAIRANPRLAAAHGTLGLVLDRLGDREGALAAHRQSIALDPNTARRHADLANTLLAYGDRAGAAASFRAALERDPGNAGYQRMLGMLDAETGSRAERESRFADPALSDEQRMHLGFALGRDSERAGDYDAAFRFLDAANRLRRAGLTYDMTETERSFDDVIAAFTPETMVRLSGFGDPDPTPIFVLGMPRSGTTLVEQILASHPAVVGAGELLTLRNVLTEATTERPVRFGSLLATLDGPTLTAMGTDYVRRLRAYAPRGGRFVTDKLPGNFMLIGLIRLILPNARIIHCTRDPADTALSVWRSYFASALNYAYDLTELGHYYRQYARVMQHWRDLLPDGFYDISNEALVADQEGETRRLLDYCGLAFDPACLDFHRTDRPVHTASAAQVRSPINRDSIGMAARYGDRLAPLYAAMRGDGR
ncbi:tetratricopeptide repeat-containing sulfotransferase family protein [Devosia sp.]|uniref:tetratricopeptide repeat-containing sulfotransferase family protein n=1 Tax=Devosia sp. TaxID=1871048 RepID=UPI003A8F2838